MTTPISPAATRDAEPPSMPGTLTATAGASDRIDLARGAASEDASRDRRIQIGGAIGVATRPRIPQRSADPSTFA